MSEFQLSFSELQTPVNTGSPREMSFGEEVKIKNNTLTCVIFGSSGDLAKRKLFPSIFLLFAQDLLPKTTNIVGYARTEMSIDQFFEKLHPFIEKLLTDEKMTKKYQEFKKRCHYVVSIRA